VIFKLKLISIPKIDRIWPGEYFVKEEKIMAVFFEIEKQSNNASYDEILFTFIDPKGNTLLIQKIDSNMHILEFNPSILLDSSGIYNLRISFTNSSNLWIFENVERWLEESDNQKYLTFGLINTTNVSYRGYYERAIPVFSMSDIIDLQQMFLSEQQSKHLSETARSLENIARDSLANAASAGIIASIVTVLLSWIAKWLYDESKEEKLDKQQWSGLHSEIESNIAKLNENINALKYLNRPISVFDNSSYQSLMINGKLNLLDSQTRKKLHNAYLLMNHYSYYNEAYLQEGKQPDEFPSHIIDLLKKAKKKLSTQTDY
jgi:hypothetical protein